MTDKPKGKIFIKLPLELLTSRAWQALGINARRFIDFIMIEHMRHGGRENGLLLAPRRQLEEFGIGQHFVSGAIEEAESLGFVDCKRGVGRRPSSYALSWLPLADDTPPSNRFLQCNAAAEAISTARKAAKQRKLRETAPVVTAKQQPVQMTAVCAENDCQTAVTKPIVDLPRFRGEMRAWDQALWLYVMLSSGFVAFFGSAPGGAILPSRPAH
jgi:hypothetical protein